MTHLGDNPGEIDGQDSVGTAQVRQPGSHAEPIGPLPDSASSQSFRVPATHRLTPLPASSDAERDRFAILGQLRPGLELFGFRLCLQLGQGSFASVFLAEQLELSNRQVVIKISAAEGFEPQTLAQMQHTHIVPIYSVHENSYRGLRAVCMPYFGGATLAQVLDHLWSAGPTPATGAEFAAALKACEAPAEFLPPLANHPPALEWLRSHSYLNCVAWIIARLAEALQHAHERGVVHSDVKPSNILIAADGQPLLLDFNVAQNQRADDGASPFGGTFTYAAPEHALAMVNLGASYAGPVEPRSDLYSLGLVMLKMLTGQNPFERSDGFALPSQLRERALERHATRLSARQVRPDVPWSLESIVRKCLASDPKQRYQQGEHLAEDLQRYLSDEPLRHAPELSRVERFHKWSRRHPRLTSWASLALVAVLIVGSAGLAVVAAIDRQQQTQQQLDRAHARELKQKVEAGTLRALCLVNTVTDLTTELAPGIALCTQTLAIFHVLERDDWQQQAPWTNLAPEDRTPLAENVRELTLLLAWAGVRKHPQDAGQLERALALLERAERIEGLAPSRALWLDRAHYLEKQGDSERARHARQHAATLEPASAQDHYLLATAFARQGTLEALRAAIVQLDRALALNPRHYWALAQRGICRQEAGERALAVSDFSACVGLSPDFAWGYFNRGYALAKIGHPQQALADFGLAVHYDPEFAPAYVNRGLLHLELGNFALALADFERAQHLGRDDAFLHSGRGVALESLGKHPAADEAFRLGFARAETLSEAGHARLAWVYGSAVLKRKPAEARAAFERSLQLRPRDPHALFGFARWAIEQNRLTEALEHLHRAADVDANFVEARRARALVHARLENWELARQDINWCLAKEPHSGVTNYAAACVTALAAKPGAPAMLAKQSLTLLRQALSLDYGRDKAATDPDLANLRGLPEFEQLLAAKAAP